MPARNFAELVERLHPGVSVRQLTEDAGLAEGAISYYLKPSTHLTRIPTARIIDELAGALGCDQAEVVQAFADDVGLPLNYVLTREEQELIRLRRRLSPSGQRLLGRLAIALFSEQVASGDEYSPPV